MESQQKYFFCDFFTKTSEKNYSRTHIFLLKQWNDYYHYDDDDTSRMIWECVYVLLPFPRKKLEIQSDIHIHKQKKMKEGGCFMRWEMK